MLGTLSPYPNLGIAMPAGGNLQKEGKERESSAAANQKIITHPSGRCKYKGA